MTQKQTLLDCRGDFFCFYAEATAPTFVSVVRVHVSLSAIETQRQARKFLHVSVHVHECYGLC